jgi:hypothetical protein
VVAAVTLLGGAMLALTSGDPRALLFLALGAAGGWAACQAASARPASVDAPQSTRNATSPAEAAPSGPTATPGELAPPPRSSRAQDGVPVATPEGTLAALPVAPALEITAPSAAVPALPPTPAPARSAVPAPVPAPAPVHAPEPVGVAAVAARQPLAAPTRVVAQPDASVGRDQDPALDEQPIGSTPLSLPIPTEGSDAGAAQDVTTPLPAGLQDLAARQRSSTADLRRSIRDVIERLEDEEPPAPRRRSGKKPRR